MAFRGSGFTGAACFSVCAVIFTMCGPLSPFGSKGGFAPWFESEESFSTTHVLNYMRLDGRCDDEVTKTNTRWSMFGFDYVTETSCNSDSALQQASFNQHLVEKNRKVTKSHDYVAMCDNPPTDGFDSFCGKRYTVLVFWWLTVGCGLTASLTAVVAILLLNKPVGILCVLASFLTSLFAVIGFAIGVSAKTDLEDHLKATYEKMGHRSSTYEVTAEAGLVLAAVAMVLAILLAPAAVFGLVQQFRQLRKPAAKAEGQVQEPGPVLLDASNREPKEARMAELKDSKPEKEEEPEEELNEAPEEIAEAAVVVEVEEEIVEDEDEGLARLATVEMEQQDEEHEVSKEALAAIEVLRDELLGQDYNAGLSVLNNEEAVESGTCGTCSGCVVNV